MTPEQIEQIMLINGRTNPDRVKEIARVVYEIPEYKAPTKYQIQDAYRYLEGGDCFRKLEEEYIVDILAKELSMKDLLSATDLLPATKAKAIALKKKISIRQAQRILSRV